ncbi:hypothetical protein ACOMHN_057024 [Nucella lapillus]
MPEGARGGVNKYRGVQKSKKNFIALRAGPAAARGCPFTRPAVDRFFYSLNIPKIVDFRGFKHPDVPEGGRGGGNKHRGVQKSTHRGWGPLTLRESRLLPQLTRLGFYSLNIPQKVDFRGFKHSDVPEGVRGGVNKYRGVQKSKNIFIALRAGPAAARGCPFTRLAVDRFFSTASTYPKWSIFGVLSTQTCRRGAGEVGTSIGESKKAHIGGGGLKI